MDRPRQAKRRRPILLPLAVVGVVGASLAAMGFARSDGTVPSVPERSVRTATVQRGDLVRSAHGPGVLASQDNRWLTATTSARVDAIEAKAGAEVSGGTVVVVLHNDDMELAALEAESELAAARAELANLRANLETDRLGQRATLATVRADQRQAKREASANESLNALVSAQERASSRDRAEELDARLSIAQQRLGVLARSRKAQVAAQQVRVDQLAAVVKFRRKQIDALTVTAGATGVLQEVPVELGQWVTPGEVLAKVVRPDLLEAELRIPEARARDLRLGQHARIDPHLGGETIEGEVSRIDPTVNAGTVTVEVRLTSGLPEGARPDQTVDGEIELEQLRDVLWVPRPARAEPGMSAGLFRVDGDRADRVAVELGRASREAIEIRAGLDEGDVVIISDSTRWDDNQTIRLETQ